MKPNFAFTLSYKGIGLLHRAFPGWRFVGEVGFDTPDLATALVDLRNKADILEASGLRSKLVIPNDQIKYITLPIDAPQGDDDLAQRVAEALIGTTPYAVEDLAFDWTRSGDQIQIAAVAKETLTEAENFACEHRFNPICFVAIPEAGFYDGEPFFGPTEFSQTDFAHTLLGGADTQGAPRIERDATAISVIGAAKFPDVDPTGVPSSDTQPTAPQEAAPSDPGVASVDGVDGVDGVEIEEAAPELATFSSIRAKRNESTSETATSAPRLHGVERTHDSPPTDTSLTAPSIPISVLDDLATPAPLSPPIATEIDAEFDAEISGENFTADFASLYQNPESQEPVHSEGPSSVGAAPQTDPDARPEKSKILSFFSRPKPSGAKEYGTGASKQPSVDEKQRMTVFGARQTEDIGGKPRYLGLVLTMVLLLFLAGVAAWATMFLDDGLAGLFSPHKDNAVIALPQPGEGDDDLAAELAVEGDEAALLERTPQELSPPTGEGTNTAPTVKFDREQALADYAATGIWQIAPDMPQLPGFRGLDDLYITSIDPRVRTSDALALPAATATLTDQQPKVQLSPVAPEIRFTYDARGLIVATTKGAITPDGITIFLGSPNRTPPTRPIRFTQDPVLVAQAVRMAKLRPRTRPGNLVEQNERSTLGGRTRVEMARLRPTARPHIPAAKLAEEADETATAQAVVVSRKPATRPNNFGKIVKRAQRQQEETVTTVAAVAPRTVSPSVPSNASVARLATARNAINLRRINLIGVYGKPSSRRALVRLANGRYKKVKVGDRIDGGRISSIGESDLRYQKGGRNVVLKMPRG